MKSIVQLQGSNPITFPAGAYTDAQILAALKAIDANVDTNATIAWEIRTDDTGEEYRYATIVPRAQTKG